MQIQKTDIRQTILEIAHAEFLKKGFENASMRNIAKQSEVTLSNIYNYFRNKDEIFCAVLAPLLNAFKRMSENHNSENFVTIDIFDNETYQQQMIDNLMEILRDYRAELRLLLFHASGSSLENFRDTFTDARTKVGIEYLQMMKAKYPYINVEISTFFMHNLSSCWLTVIGEFVTHDELTNDDIEKFLTEYVVYGTAGWKALMKV